VFLRKLIKPLHDGINGGPARGEFGLALFNLFRLGDLGEAEPADHSQQE
jgi:hypothetical protein